MALTKVEAAKLSNDMLLAGVIQTIVKESPVLQMLPFLQVVGTNIRYNRETTMPGTNFYEPGDTWTEATPTFTSVTAALTILGGDADVDNFLQQTYADSNDIEAEIIANRAKAIAHQFSDTFFNGNTTTSPKSFDGLDTLVTGNQVVAAGTNGGALTEAMIDELIDKVRPGTPDALFVSRRTRRQMKALRRGDGISQETQLNEWGQRVQTYDGIPILVDDFISDSQIRGTGSNLSSIYAVKFGTDVGVAGLENGGITVETVGELETKDATRHRIKWYAGLGLFSTLGAARLVGLTA